MASQKDIVQHIREEDNDFYSDDDLFKISSWGADLSFRELIDRYDDDELVKPELQRKYVWDKTEASRFIDSILLGLPVPSIFLAKTSNEKMLIIDGYQRIMTIHDYVKGIFSGDGKVFKLSRSEKINSKWRGKAFSELSDPEQRKIRNTTIHAIIFVQQHPEGDDTSLYQVFERINTSGRTLMPQEIRNCVYQGSFNTLLMKLNQNESWRLLFGLESEDQRMRDIEFILRYLALSSELYKQETKERISLKKFLNLYMGNNRNINEQDSEILRTIFERTVSFIIDNIGPQAFHNLSTKDPNKLVPKFSPTIFDSIMVATNMMLEDSNNVDIQGLENKRRELLSDDEYRQAISKETMKINSINKRVNLVKSYLYGID